MKARIIACTAGLMVSWFGAVVHAEPKAQDDPVMEEAGRLFKEATEEINAGHPAIGRDLFRRSLMLYPTIPTRYNLGVALRATGESLEAVATFEGLLREPELTAKQRSQTREQLELARADIATLTVRITGAAKANVELDGRGVGVASSKEPLVLRVDAGEHVVLAEAGGSTRSKLRVARGEEASLSLHVLALSEQKAQEKKRRRRRAGWISAAGIVVAGAVVAAAVTTRDTTTRGAVVEGDTGTFETLRRR